MFNSAWSYSSYGENILNDRSELRLLFMRDESTGTWRLEFLGLDSDEVIGALEVVQGPSLLCRKEKPDSRGRNASSENVELLTCSAQSAL